MKHPLRMSTWIWLLLVFTGMAMPAMAGSVPAETFACIADDKLEQTVAVEAQVEELSCFFKKFEGLEALHFKVTLKNVSDKEQRYKVNIFTDNDKAVGGLIPRKTKGGLVAPGASASFVYPVNGMAGKPTGVALVVRTLAP